MYDKANLDIVSVTTHNFHHHEPVIEAAEAGIKVIMVEKPLAISVEWGRKMVEACEANGCRLSVDHTRRFLPHYRRLKKMVDDGAVGDVRTITYSGARPLAAQRHTHSRLRFLLYIGATQARIGFFSAMNPLLIPVAAGWLCAKAVLLSLSTASQTRKESLSDVIIGGTAGQIHFCERRGIWEYAPLVDANEGYGSRYDFAPLPDMPEGPHP